MNLELDSNQLSSAALDAIRAVLHSAGKTLGSVEDNDSDLEEEDDLAAAIEEFAAADADAAEEAKDEEEELLVKAFNASAAIKD